jgi:hypothetical protein
MYQIVRQFFFVEIEFYHFNITEGRGDGAFCGNGRIDEGEECDAGYHTKNDMDLCCNDKCQLRAGMKCR